MSLFISYSVQFVIVKNSIFNTIGTELIQYEKVTAYRTRPLDDLPSTLSDTSTTHLAHLTGSIQLLGIILNDTSCTTCNQIFLTAVTIALASYQTT